MYPITQAVRRLGDHSSIAYKRSKDAALDPIALRPRFSAGLPFLFLVFCCGLILRSFVLIIVVTLTGDTLL